MLPEGLPMDASIQEFVDCRRVAVVGCSRTRHKFGNSAFIELKRRGYEVVPVHPTEREILGAKCSPNLTSLRGEIDAVLISVSPDRVIPILEEAASIGLRHVWLQQGAETPESIPAAERLGLAIVVKKCVLLYAPPVRSFHRLHRVFAKLTRSY
jgi:predicted CoA-binding protein